MKDINMTFDLENSVERDLFCLIQQSLLDFNRTSPDKFYEIRITQEDNFTILQAILVYYDDSFNVERVQIVDDTRVRYVANLGDGKYEYTETEREAEEIEQYARAFANYKNNDAVAVQVYERVNEDE